MAEPLIPRRKIFGNPSYVSPKISPDGQWLSWSAPLDGVLNIWVAPHDDVSAARAVTRTKGMPIWWHVWSGDSTTIVFANDEIGDEKTHIFAVDPKTCELRDLTPFENVTASFDAPSWLNPRKMPVWLNDRDERWHDVYVIDLDSGERELVFENRFGFDFMFVDQHLKPRIGRSTLENGGAMYWKIDGEKPVEYFALSYEDNLQTYPVSFSFDGSKLLMVSSIGRNTSALLEVDWESGAQRVLAEHAKYDLAGLIVHPKSFELLMAGVNGVGVEWIFIADEIKQDWALLREKLAGFDISIESATENLEVVLLAAHKPQQGAIYYEFDRRSKSLRELFCARPEMRDYKLAPMQVVESRARDGLDLVSLLTLPVDVKGVRPAKPIPLVLDVHGGPWGQDTYGYNREHQWLANRGYAVLSVNYRASTGYGKAFTAAGEKQHARAMHDDLIDVVNWAIAEGIADPAKIAITGASYGGYASFVGATFTPEVFCCSVPVVGITNLQTLLESMPPYWAGFAEFMYRSYGDPRTEEGRALLAERSPIHHVDKITKPMLIFHGLNDVRCKVAESDTIVAAMQAKSIPVSYVVYTDEGHGFSKHENQLSYYAMMEVFFAKHLGGRFEEFGNDLEGASYEVRAGHGAALTSELFRLRIENQSLCRGPDF